MVMDLFIRWLEDKNKGLGCALRHVLQMQIDCLAQDDFLIIPHNYIDTIASLRKLRHNTGHVSQASKAFFFFKCKPLNSFRPSSPN